MKTVGVRELKDKLSEYIRKASKGESVLVTDRGEVVAELSPPGAQAADPSIPAALVALARVGQVDLGAKGDAKLYPELPRPRHMRLSVADMLNEERGPR